jgi:putative glutamine amidotransferase
LHDPLIGITVGPREDGSPYVQTRLSYVRAIEIAGGLPVLIPPLGEDALDALLERLDGIVFPGGADVDPA